MATFKRFSILLIVLFSLIAGTSPTARAIVRDGGGWPTVVVSDTPFVPEGGHATLVIYMNRAVTSNTTVTLTSSDPSLLSVPTTVTVPAGSSAVQTSAASLTPPVRLRAGASSSYVTVTATANGYSASTTLEVEQ